MTGTDIGLHVADVYAGVIYDLAEQAAITEEAKSEMELLADLIAREKDFLYIMASPQFSGDYKQSLLQKMFEGKINELTFNFLLTVGRHNRMVFLPQIIAKFVDLWDAHHGLSAVELTVHENLAENELKDASAAIASAMGKKVLLKLNVKPAIMGGAVIRFGDSVIDNSIKARLHRAVRTIIDRCKETGIKDEVQYQ
jgi:F-type H+-transporting ATPase subunit delta